jgi:hypothetical protein
MRTLVYQSYRTVDVPAWIARSLETVREWSAARGFEYRFIDDELFEYVPTWYRDKVENRVQLVSDLARLEVAKQILSEGYDRAVWVDADVVVFDPDSLTIDVTEEYAFCREVWLEQDEPPRRVRHWWGERLVEGKVTCSHSINNAVSVFVQGNTLLDFYIDACKWIVRSKSKPISVNDVGVHFVSLLHRIMEFSLISNVGMFSPVVMRDIGEGGGACLRLYVSQFGSRVAAANLCSSMRGRTYNEVDMSDELFDRVVERLLETKGGVVNQYYRVGG